ncbi:hypothetical protein C1645_862820 [Glomus cerebriforme]|uniref:BACK domain-containing protein n=1 Tax=Glomus cerebriforme TaxID=658196 RepID=A0A397S7J5_9GLOM|nr:hypothetical protein C1645_862820 [Glomus cerebriforme]
MSSRFWADLSNDYEKRFETEIGYDVIIYAGEESDIKEIQIFYVLDQNIFVQPFLMIGLKKKMEVYFKKPNISSHLFNIILRILIEYHNEFLHKNPIGILDTIYQHETFTELWKFCLEKICEKPQILFNSDKFINLKAPLLELLLKRDDLNLSEIETWESLLKWCFSQQKIVNNPAKWNEDDIIKLEGALYRFITLIRFYDIKPADFFYKFPINMKPKTNLAPSRRPKIDSTLVESDYFSFFASWIDKKDSLYFNKKHIPYEFKLLYRSNWNDFDASSFHNNCDNKGATWVVYSAVAPLDKMHWTYGNNETTSNSYSDINIPRYFNVEDYEVLQIIKR